MRVEKLDHVNIQTRDLDGTARFFADVLGLERRPPPGLDPATNLWMYDEHDRPIVHLSMPGTLLGGALLGESKDDVRAGGGSVHHIAFDCSGYADFVARLVTLGVGYGENHVTEIDLRQVFIHEPNGVMVECNFRAGAH
jgi:catechol 2,3-dioxygenase-like lactoylglutathione lyase family enzyme